MRLKGMLKTDHFVIGISLPVKKCIVQEKKERKKLSETNFFP